MVYDENIRMPLQGLFLVSFLDIIFGCIPGNAKNCIIILSKQMNKIVVVLFINNNRQSTGRSVSFRENEGDSILFLCYYVTWVKYGFLRFGFDASDAASSVIDVRDVLRTLLRFSRIFVMIVIIIQIFVGRSS
jgi:hypothetical protein